MPGAAALAGETDVAGNATIGKLDKNVSKGCLVSARFYQILAIFYLSDFVPLSAVSAPISVIKFKYTCCTIL